MDLTRGRKERQAQVTWTRPTLVCIHIALDVGRQLVWRGQFRADALNIHLILSMSCKVGVGYVGTIIRFVNVAQHSLQSNWRQIQPSGHRRQEAECNTLEQNWPIENRSDIRKLRPFFEPEGNKRSLPGLRYMSRSMTSESRNTNSSTWVNYSSYQYISNGQKTGKLDLSIVILCMACFGQFSDYLLM